MLKVGDKVKFIREKDYEVIEPKLGRGSFGNTILIKDNNIDELFVAKRYNPQYPELKEAFYNTFVKEIKIMHKLYHKNVVRIFNYYLFPKYHTGYIIMEYFDGKNIETILSDETFFLFGNIDEIFIQLINAFSYLEKNGIIHRDIRTSNILVDSNNNVKLIDFGLGKIVKPITNGNGSDTFKEIIDRTGMEILPNEFYQGIYTHQTDMFCIAELLNRLIKRYKIDFSYHRILNKMMQVDPLKRYNSFDEILDSINKKEFELLNVSDEDKNIYQTFSSALSRKLTCFLKTPNYNTDVNTIINGLEDILTENVLEDYIQDNSKLISLFIKSAYKYKVDDSILVEDVKSFYRWFKDLTRNFQNIIIHNIILKLSKKEVSIEDNDLPF